MRELIRRLRLWFTRPPERRMKVYCHYCRANIYVPTLDPHRGLGEHFASIEHQVNKGEL